MHLCVNRSDATSDLTLLSWRNLDLQKMVCRGHPSLTIDQESGAVLDRHERIIFTIADLNVDNGPLRFVICRTRLTRKPKQEKRQKKKCSGRSHGRTPFGSISLYL
jgi:hypothetical protein